MQIQWTTKIRSSGLEKYHLFNQGPLAKFIVATVSCTKNMWRAPFQGSFAVTSAASWMAKPMGGFVNAFAICWPRSIANSGLGTR